MKKYLALALEQEADVSQAVQQARELAIEMGFTAIDCAEICLAVSEIAQNVIRYAGEGQVVFYHTKDERSLIAIISDNGPGIENVDVAMENGFSTLKGSLGIGLEVARRSADEFEIVTDPENGTEVTIKKFLPIPENEITYGVVSLADERYATNGGDYLVKEYDGNKVLMAVIDGTGGGYAAHVASVLVKEYLEANYRLSLTEIAEACHRLLTKADLKRGATIALAKIENGHFYYLGLGDTHAYLAGNDTNYLHNFEGTLGFYQLPSLKTYVQPLEPDTYIVLCTNGIKPNVALENHSLIGAQPLANEIFRQHHRDYGDVTVLVAKYTGGL